MKKIKNIKLEQFGRGCFITKSPSKMDIKLAQNGLEKVKRILSKKNYDVVVLDEINIALYLGLIDLIDVLEILKKTPKKIELVLTGRKAHPKILNVADLVSEIKEIKHYFNKGIPARKGIEF